MYWVIVPDALSDAINAALDKAIRACPGAASERDALYQQLLSYYDEHGVIPEFSLEKRKP
jgi:hypothetical protein